MKSREAVEWIEENNNPLALLHLRFVNYPTADENAALGMIPALARIFSRHVTGYSDHTLPRDMDILRKQPHCLAQRGAGKTFHS